MEVSRDTDEDSQPPRRGFPPCPIANSPPKKDICSLPSEGKASTSPRSHAHWVATAQPSAARAGATAREQMAALEPSPPRSAPTSGAPARAATNASPPRTAHWSSRCSADNGALSRSPVISPAQGHSRSATLTIYRHIWPDQREAALLDTDLRGARKRRPKRYGADERRGKLSGKRPLSERPAVVEQPIQTGHWERDSVMGTASLDCIVSLVERQSGLVIIGKLEDRTTPALNQRVIRLINRHRGRVETITADNGTEFHDYTGSAAKSSAILYFATPHHWWERASNENANGLMRQSLPKGQRMAGLSQQQCKAIARRLHTWPRKGLGCRTPLECFNES